VVSTQAKRPLRVMLVDDDAKRAAWVEKCLGEMGFDTCSVVDDAMRVLKVVSDDKPDVVIIDMASPGRDILESLSILSHHQPTPVVMFSGEEDPDYISRAVDAGVSTYLVGGIDPEKVKPIIEVAFAQFRSFQQLRTALNETRLELNDQRAIERAKRLLMRTLRISEAEAYEHLRSEAMSCGARLADMARRIVGMSEKRGIEK